MTTLRDLGEFGLIERLTRGLPLSEDVLQGVGDDCAVVRVGDRILLISTDAAIEEVHFSRRTASPADIGWKAAAAALSDIAAMGGEARFVLVTLACPVDTEAEAVEALYGGIRQAVEACGAAIIGGDTTQSLARIVLDIVVIGEAVKGNYRLRRGARPGDVLAVTGYPGCSAAGLLALGAHVAAPPLVAAHLRPMPRLEEGRWLARRDEVHAIIDVSDGLAQDAGHVAAAGDLGLDIDPNALPIAPALEAHRDALGISPRDLAIAGGEDYELAVAIDGAAHHQVIAAFRSAFDVPITVVGQFTDAPKGIRVAGVTLTRLGFQHFRR
ncbi:MAG TPA: thiamine-phosphate kinase [Candidatus Hydrogenedentes bacterium]|nr:thiamine-phosphate kinase [Candidatus Hydrogenedentota bacterium]